MIVGKIQRFLFSIIKPLCFGERKKLCKCFPLVVLGGHWWYWVEWADVCHAKYMQCMFTMKASAKLRMQNQLALPQAPCIRSMVGLCPRLCFLRFFMCVSVCVCDGASEAWGQRWIQPSLILNFWSLCIRKSFVVAKIFREPQISSSLVWVCGFKSLSSWDLR